MGEDPARVWGAGILLASTTVLTCWHVIVDVNGAEPHEIRLDFPQAPTSPPMRAAITRVIPIAADDSGDLAVLTLPTTAPVTRARLLDRGDETRVRVFGYPPHLPTGVWVSAAVSGAVDERTGWRRLHQLPGSAPIGRGFSGAGVHDEMGAVLGIVVARGPLSGQVAAGWMIPTRKWPIELLEPPIRQTMRAVAALGFADKRALATALEEVSVLRTPEGRRMVVQNLPPNIRRVVPVHNMAGLDLFGIVDAVLAFDDGFQELYSVVTLLAGEQAAAVIRLRRIAAGLGLVAPA